MSLDLASVRRYSRQIGLPEIGSEGQERLLGAEVALAGDDPALETCARYLAGAGVPRFRVMARDGASAIAGVVGDAARLIPWPADGPAWEEALDGVSLVVRSGFDDDAMVRAAVRLGVPAVVVRAGAQAVDVLSLRVHGPCPHQSLDVPVQPASAPSADGGASVLAGTLAASEAVLVLARPRELPRARHLHLSLEADTEPAGAEIPWSPECFLCGGSGRELVTR
jgi:hypothetical protein